MAAAMQGDSPARPGLSVQPVLQLIVDAVAEMAGFEQVALSVVLGGALVVVAFAGSDDQREDALSLASALDPPPTRPERGGRVRFVPADRPGDVGSTGDWQPDDVLFAVLSHDDGRTAGVLSLAAPRTGRRPDEAQLRLLERCAAQAERAVVTAFERDDLLEQIAHAESARRMVRAALVPAHPSLEAVLEHTHRPLVEGFRATGSWIELVDPAAVGSGFARARNTAVIPLPEELVGLAHELAARLWAEQRVLVIEAEPRAGAEEALAEDLTPIRRELGELGLATALAVPLGAGRECFGFLALARRPQDPPWSQVETESALQIGHDLGAALRTASALERERTLVRELQQLDDYRSGLIATLSHELRTPLTVIAGNLEMLGSLDLDETVTRHHRAMTRGATRMRQVVDDLLLLARVSNPQHPLEATAVDLREVVDEVVAMVSMTMRTKQVALEVVLPDDRLVVQGDPTELDRLVANLVSNAAKYTDPGGCVTITVVRRPDAVVLAVADDGIGISEEDQQHLFQAFFRTSNPDALRQPGTGLGLAIVATIAERHGGEVRVDSALGLGTTFTVTLPAG